MDYRICGLFVLFFFAANSAAGTTAPPSQTTPNDTSISTAVMTTTPVSSSTKLQTTAITAAPVETTTTPKPVNCLIGTCAEEECDNSTHTSTYTSQPCKDGKCATEKHANGTLTYRCAGQSEKCETNTLTLTCCDTPGCNTHEAYKQEITKLGKKNGASTVTAQLHLLSIGIISLRLILM